MFRKHIVTLIRNSLHYISFTDDLQFPVVTIAVCLAVVIGSVMFLYQFYNGMQHTSFMYRIILEVKQMDYLSEMSIYSILCAFTIIVAFFVLFTVVLSEQAHYSQQPICLICRSHLPAFSVNPALCFYDVNSFKQ